MFKMKFKYQGKKITGILTVVPKNEKTFDEEMENYQASKARTKRLKAVMGFEKHKIVEEGVCVSDLAVFGMEYLFRNELLNKEDIDSLVVVTESPDYIMPGTSTVIQGILGLRHEVYCLDLNQGCAGFIVGLQQAFSLLDQEDIRKVVLINADVLSRRTSKQDRNSYPLIGDAASITIVENDSDLSNVAYGVIKMDGQRMDALMIPAGGFRIPSTPETSILRENSEGNLRSLNHLVMKGGDVFNFMQTEVPPLIDELMLYAGKKKENIDWYLFHQPNKFMVDKLADAMGVPHEKMPSNIVTYFGNASGVTIPTNICFNLGKKLLDHTYEVCLSGFGVGLTWGAWIMKLGKFDFCRLIEF